MKMQRPTTRDEYHVAVEQAVAENFEKVLAAERKIPKAYASPDDWMPWPADESDRFWTEK